MNKEKNNEKNTDKKTKDPQETMEYEKVETKKTEIPKETKEKITKTGIAYIYTSFNNTIVHITDMVGNTIARVSGGMVTKHDRLKATPTVAMFAAKRAAEEAKTAGLNTLYVKVRAATGSPALGPGAHAAIKSLGREGLHIINITDLTRMPRGGPKPKGGKRGRRV